VYKCAIVFIVAYQLHGQLLEHWFKYCRDISMNVRVKSQNIFYSNCDVQIYVCIIVPIRDTVV